MNREDYINTIFKERIIIILRNIPTEKLVSAVQALYLGGIKVVEITFSSNNELSNSETASNIKLLCNEFSDNMLIGAGTVTSTEQVEIVKKSGGKFIISPDTNPDVIKKTRALNLISIPGAFTPSEIISAKHAGADFVKIFPASCAGFDYIKAIKAPLSDIPLLAVGGINISNIDKFWKSGICGFGIGSNIINYDNVKSNDFENITKLSKDYISKVKSL